MSEIAAEVIPEPLDPTLGAASAIPGHFWAVAIVSLLWNAFGAYDYTMTQLGDAEYLAQFTPEQRAFFASFPGWLTVFWALGVWGSMAGSVLLLLRSRRAVAAFQVSLLGLAVSTVAQFTMTMPESLRTPAMMAMNVVIWASLLFFLWYAAQMRDRGVLR
ncbi:MAG: hypothetical protein ABW194_06400 [Novosphingobium sp.]